MTIGSGLFERTGDLTIATDLGVPRSTARGWLGVAPTVVVSLEGADLPEPELRQEILTLRRLVEKRAALLRLALALFHTSGFRRSGERLPDGQATWRRLRGRATASTARALRDPCDGGDVDRVWLRRGELLALTLESIRQREEHGGIADLVGKGGHVRTVPIPSWVNAALDEWTAARARIEKLAPHHLRRTCARLCHLAGGEWDQIQFLPGHVSIQTTERYLGCSSACGAP